MQIFFNVVQPHVTWRDQTPKTGRSKTADLNEDSVADIFDIVQVALVFGWPW
ncbi:hypothetical protein MUO74_07870 [Candidatus Bathyarchaeota archaeon]|nr:hypothetical protein [Candidatus Bathyarchaeota archaeon]